MAGDSKPKVVKRTAVAPPIRVRKLINKMTFKDPIIEFYARAIVEMQKLPLDNPLSWRYQAAIHDYPRVVRATAGSETDAEFRARRSSDPNAILSEAVPSTTDQIRFWRQCQHTSWFFLPWHRMYLHHFEQIVLSHVIELKGPADWALPYWNYALPDADAGHLPEPFRLPTMPGPGGSSSPNPLFILQRDPDAMAGRNFADANRRDAALTCLDESQFEPNGASQGFGGPPRRNHPLGGLGGSVESSPHNGMHGSIAGRDGFMGGGVTAPLDPIFWIHHCNIDRLWRAWQRKKSTVPANPAAPPFTEPTRTEWADQAEGVRLRPNPFSFNSATGAIVDMFSKEVLDTKRVPFEYIYDDEPTP